MPNWLFGNSKPFQHIHKQAKKVQQSIFDRQQGKYGTPSQKTEMSNKEKAEAVVQYFLKAGLDLKGLSQSCYETKGGGLQVEVTIDPARIFFGIFSTSITLSGQVSKSKEVLLIAQRGPSKIQSSNRSLEIPTPIMLNCLIGSYWEGGVKAGIEIGFSVQYSLGSDGKSKTEKSCDQKEEDEDEPAIQLESSSLDFEMGLEAEAKLGFQAEMGYTYEHFYAEDACPIPCNDHSEAANKLKELFKEGSYKAIVKKKTCDFINKNSQYFGTVKYETYLGLGHIGSQELIEILESGLKKVTRSSTIYQQARSLRDNLHCWTGKNKPIIPTSIRISSHKGDGKAGLMASAEVSLNVPLVKTSIGVSAEALKISGQYKSSSVRYQAVYPAPHVDLQKSYVVMTQDTKIVYKQIEFTPISAKIEGSVKVPLYSKSKEKEIECKLPLLNHMTYTTATVFWHSFVEESKSKVSQQMLQVKESQESKAVALPGSGVSFGRSFEIDNLLSFYESYDTITKRFTKNKKYFNTVATSLHVTLDDLIKVFTSIDKEFLEDLKEANDVEAVLLEASFRVDKPNITLVQTIKKGDELIELKQDTAKTFLALPRTLEAIRLRYRIQDTFVGDSELFSLGFKIAGQGLGIKLQKVNRAGSEGIIDLATIWIDSTLDACSGPEAYEKAVPQVSLFCQ